MRNSNSNHEDLHRFPNYKFRVLTHELHGFRVLPGSRGVGICGFRLHGFGGF